MTGARGFARRLNASLRGRLLMWLLPAACVVGVLASTGTYWGALRELDDLLDDQMRSMSKQIQVDDAGKLSIEGRDRLAKRHPADYDSDDVLLQVWRGGKLEFTTDPATQLPPPAAAGFVTLDAGGQRWHTYVRESAGTTIRVAQPRQARWEAIAGIAVHLLWPVLSLLPLLAIGLWLGIGYGLRPLGAIAAGLKRRHANRLDPLDITTVPTEAQPLASEINDLLARLDRSFTLQRHFIADAAHELRTPIMGLSIQTQLLQRTASADERARILAQIQAGTTRLSHLAEQLLTLARLEPEARSAPFAELDLAALGRSVVAERARIAAAQH
ncbi:histidine kinase dimerization/phospho-acceptor domain-containing protein, partial [Burkholderia pseudomallei]